MKIGLVTSSENLQIGLDRPSLDRCRHSLAPPLCLSLTLIEGQRSTDRSSPHHCLSGLSLQASLLGCSGAPSLKVFHFIKLTWNFSLFFSLTLSLSELKWMKLFLSLSLSLFFNKTNSLSYEMNETLSICDWLNFSFINFFCLFLTFWIWLYQFMLYVSVGVCNVLVLMGY